MAIKITGTSVIDRSTSAPLAGMRFKNLTGVEGEYDNVQPKYSTQTIGTGNLTPSMADEHQEFLTLNGSNVIIQGISGTTGGDQFTYFVDGSNQLHDLSFVSGGSITWLFENDSEPDWTTARYWTIVITSWDASVHSVTATSWGA
jgi:hypothetical protein